MNNKKKFDNVALIVYSHSDYSDVWPLFFGQSEKFLGDFENKYFLVDKQVDIPGWQILEYDDSLSYNERVASCLGEVREEFVILHHEDMPLYEKPEIEVIEKLPSAMKEYGLDFVKFGAINLHTSTKLDEELNLFKIDSAQYLMAVQPSIWGTSRLFEVYEKSKIKNIQDFEHYASFVANTIGINGSFLYNNEPLRGEFHYDTKVYPYIATAVVAGKWDLLLYKNELGALLREYDIDPKERGHHG